MSETRQELLRLIAELSQADSELRLGQMITNLSTMARGPQTESAWDCEDDELVAAAKRLLTVLQERRSAAV